MSSMCSSGNSSGSNNNTSDSSFNSSTKNLKPSVSVTSFIAFVSNLQDTDVNSNNNSYKAVELELPPVKKTIITN